MSGLSSSDLSAVLLTLRLAAVATVCLVSLATPVAWWLARTSSRWRAVIEPVTSLPLVLPPTVLGFYLLVLLGPAGPIGRVWEGLGGDRLVFSFPGLVIGSVIFSFPFAVQPLRNAFQAVGDRPLDAAALLGASPLDRFFTVVLPLARTGFVTAATLGFAHTVGEFGVVLMIGGNIPGRTQVVSVAIYDHVEALDYASAHLLSAGMVAFALAVLWVVSTLERGSDEPHT